MKLGSKEREKRFRVKRFAPGNSKKKMKLPSLTTSSPIRSITGAMVLTLTLLALIAVINWRSSRYTSEILLNDLECRELADSLENAPEITNLYRTMINDKQLSLQSAYRYQVELLRADLDRIQTISPSDELRKLASDLSLANDALISIEKEAIRMAMNGDFQSAQQATNSEQYADALDAFDRISPILVLTARERVDNTIETIRRQSALVYAFIISIVPILMISWGFTIFSVRKSIKERMGLISELEHLSMHDTLTNVYNRHGFMSVASKVCQTPEKRNNLFSVIFADLDGLKWINDHKGHDIGDKALIAATSVLKESIRESDQIGRLGGDEFVVLISDSDLTNPDSLLLRIQKRVELYNEEHNEAFDLSMSCGVVQFYPHSKSLEEALAEADGLMYKIKKRKKSAASETEIINVHERESVEES